MNLSELDKYLEQKPTDDSKKEISVDLNDMLSNRSFFEFIKTSGLKFDTHLVEDFLLSLKAKQFLILSGGTGTGKTQLAKIYGEFISHTESKYTDFSVTIGKGPENHGFTLSSDTFYNTFPYLASESRKTYTFLVGDVEGRARIDLTPRMWMDHNDPNWGQVLAEFERLKKINNKTTLRIKITETDPSSKNYLIVPVGSNWTDNRHILGYRNAITNTYSHTPTLDFILRSNKTMNLPHLLILDEMNLSHVERYFSDVISCMESHEPIHLDISNKDKMIKELELRSNLFVAGTVNMDETTYMFSPKVLDRANVIEFEPVSVSEYFTSDQVDLEPSGDVKFLQNCMNGLECRTMNAQQIINEIRAVNENISIINELITDLDRIQKIMASMKLSFGFRALDEIMRFMYVAWIYEGRGTYNNWKRYMDSQIRQKIIPKIQGNSSISIALKEFVSFCEERLYPRSFSKLERMVTVLETQRYVSFNC